MVDDDDLDVRCHAIEALGHLLPYRRRRRRVVPRLKSLLRAEEPELRFWACFALAAVGNRSDIPALRPLLDDKTLVPRWWSVRREARWAIEEILGRRTDTEVESPLPGEI